MDGESASSAIIPAFLVSKEKQGKRVEVSGSHTVDISKKRYDKLPASTSIVADGTGLGSPSSRLLRNDDSPMRHRPMKPTNAITVKTFPIKSIINAMVPLDYRVLCSTTRGNGLTIFVQDERPWRHRDQMFTHCPCCPFFALLPSAPPKFISSHRS